MSVPVINISRMRRWEQATWATGQTEAAVIHRVGEKIARLALRMTSSNDTILILAGKGHNGDDTRAAKEFLTDRKVILLDMVDPRTALPELKRRAGLSPGLIIDGLFGIGLSRPLDGNWKKIITVVNQFKIPVLAVDVPSGLNADSGEPQGAAIEAAVTLTVGAPKIGMLQQSAWPFVGRLEVAEDVGLVPCPLKGGLIWTLPGDFAGFPPRRGIAGHKGSYGHLAIIAGSFGFHGAAVLAARAAQRAQPGLITLFTQEITYRPVAEQLQAVMVNVWKPEIKLPKSTSAILIGPGLAAPDIAKTMKTVAQKRWRDSKLPVIVDASALGWLKPHVLPKNRIRVVTPHPGEAARMLGKTVPQIQSDRPQALRKISRRFGNCWVVLKGHQTLIGRSSGEIFVNSTGNPYLAQGGSGDVLAGFIAGLLAQPALHKDVGKTLRYAVWQHGNAADALQATGNNWVVEDLVVKLAVQG
jgi:hydroxyethylthiazole kinase-like uncharacterized protein yjeF